LIISEGSISSKISRSQLTCCAAYIAAMYSASQIDNATIDCLMDSYIIEFPTHINRYFVIDLPVYISSVQFEFKYSYI
jgi:hypothetical protein